MSEFEVCSYIPQNRWRFEYFFASGVNDSELEELFEKGWRKFGIYYFRPNCDSCFKCVPIRIKADQFRLSKSQRRLLRRSSLIDVKFSPLKYSEEIFRIYNDHSQNRFNKKIDRDNFLTTFYMQSCPSFQSEYYIGSELIGVGFIDKSSKSLSSVYYIFKTEYAKYRPGIYSILKEIEYTASLGLKYYYLGYYIKDNHSMAYKDAFHPNEKFDWHTGKWL